MQAGQCSDPRYLRASASGGIAAVASEVALLIFHEWPTDPDVFRLGFMTSLKLKINLHKLRMMPIAFLVFESSLSHMKNNKFQTRSW